MRRPLFRAKGFTGIGVADIMKAADLTHGGFYGHFTSKDDLVAQASRRTMARSAANWTRVVAQAHDPYAALLQHYLTPRHRDERLRLRGAQQRRRAQRQNGAQCLRRRTGAPDRHSGAVRAGPHQSDPPAQGGRRHGWARGRVVARPRRGRPGLVGRNYRRREVRAVGGSPAVEHYSLTAAARTAVP